VCLETKSIRGYVYYIYIDEYEEREGKNPFFIGQVKILTIHLKREFNKPVEVSAPEGHCRAIWRRRRRWCRRRRRRRVNALFGRPIGVDCARRARTRVCCATQWDSPYAHRPHEQCT